MKDKILHLADIHNPSELGERRVLMGGCFDIVHVGHIRLLQGSKKCGGSVIVALESDEFIYSAKHRAPLHTQAQRALVVASIEYVDKVVLLPYLKGDEAYFSMVKKISPHIIAVEEGDLQIQIKRKHAAKIGADVKTVSPHIDIQSSSTLLDLLKRKML